MSTKELVVTVPVRDNMALYEDEHTRHIVTKAEDMAKSNGSLLSPLEVNKWDSMHYQGHAELENFMDLYTCQGDDNETTQTSKKALDVGAGLGGTSRFLTYKYKQFHVTALEYLPHHVSAMKRLNQLCEGLDDRLEVQQGDFLSMEEQLKQQYDVLVSQLCFVHIADNDSLWDSCAKAVKVGGLVYNEDFYWLQQDKDKDTEDLLANKVSAPIGSLMTRENYEHLLEKKGFEIVEWRDRTPEWSQFVWDRWHQFRQGLNSNHDDPRSSEYLSKIDTFYGTIARALHQTPKINDIGTTLENTTDEELADLDLWMKRPQHVGGVVLIARRVDSSS